MGRPKTGAVIERDGVRGRTFSLRFTAPNGQRRFVTLGREADGWTLRRAEEELQAVMADLRRGRPHELMEEPKPDPDFASFSFEWFERIRGELRPNTVLDYEWQLVRHLLPFFGRLPLSAITEREVDRYRQAKVREGELSATSINKTLTRLAQVLEVAVEYRILDRNPARGRNRRLKQSRHRGTFLATPEEIVALLDGAGEMDVAGRTEPHRRPLLATLVFAGLRIDEALSLRWRHVSLPSRTLRVASSKTDAGERTVDLVPALVDELLAMRARGWEPDALVFATATGGKQSASNVRNRLLAGAVQRADQALAAQDRPPLPEPLTPHSLRRTFISVLLSLGEPVPYVMEQAGHSSPELTLGIYARVMRRSEGDKARLRAVVDGGTLEPSGPEFRHHFGTNAGSETRDPESAASV